MVSKENMVRRVKKLLESKKEINICKVISTFNTTMEVKMVMMESFNSKNY